MTGLYTGLKTAALAAAVILGGEAIAQNVLPAGKLYANQFAKGNDEIAASQGNLYILPLQGSFSATLFNDISNFSFAANAGGVWTPSGFWGYSIGNFAKVFTGVRPSGGMFQKPTYIADFDSFGASSMTCNEVTGDIYGCFFGSAPYKGDGAPYILGVLDTATGNFRGIADLGRRLYVVASDENGRLFAIDGEGTLLEVNKYYGTLTPIGSTGVTPMSGMQQDGCVNPSDGMLYWAAYTADGKSSLYKVDLGSGNATKVYDMDGSQRYTGMYVPTEYDVQSPVAIADLKAQNKGTDSDIHISFTMPARRINGNDLGASVRNYTYTVMVDGTTIAADVTAAPGEAVDLVYPSDAGLHEVVAGVRYEALGDYRKSPKAASTVYVGMDLPDVVTGLQADVAGKRVALSWKAPESGKNGGVIDPALLAYDVVRLPEGIKVASAIKTTSFEDYVNTDHLENHSYRVTLIYDGEERGSVETAVLVVGPQSALPYSQDFESMTSLSDIGWADNDGKWTRMEETDGETVNHYLNLPSNTRNSYLFSSPLPLKAGHTYNMKFDLKVRYVYGTKLSVGISDVQQHGHVVSVLANDKSFVSPHEDFVFQYETQEFIFTAEADGTYFATIYTNGGGGNAGTLNIDNFRIDDLSGAASPMPVENMRLSRDAASPRDVTVAFRLPSVMSDGSAISSIDKVEIARNGKTIAELDENLVPGTEMKYEDIHSPGGSNRYSVTVVIDGDQAPAEEDVIESGYQYDLAVSIDGPSTMAFDAEEDFTITVINEGYMPVPSDEYTVTLFEDGERLQYLSGESLLPDETAEITVTLRATADKEGSHTYHAVAYYDADQFDANNSSKHLFVDYEKAPSGVETVKAAGLRVETVRGAITADCEADAELVVTGADGTIFGHYRSTGDPIRIELRPGVYVVRAGSDVLKVMVK